MDDLLDALTVNGRFYRKIARCAIWVGFPLAMASIAAAEALLELVLKAPVWWVLINVAVVWLLWTVWHSFLFERHRMMYRSRDKGYRDAFITDIFPGVTVGFSQMLRPSFNGINMSCDRVFPTMPENMFDAARCALGASIAVVGLLLLISAWRTLGTARVGFVSEFFNPSTFVPVRRGPYARVRHPLFWSGIMLSWSCTLLSGLTEAAAAIAAVNASYGLIYNRLEDRRLKRVFGDCYASYAREVPRIAPWGAVTNSNRDVQTVAKSAPQPQPGKLRAS